MQRIARRSRSNIQFAFALLAVILLDTAANAADERCMRQSLLRCRPSGLGVVNIAIFGQLFNSETKATQDVLLRAFVKITRTKMGWSRFFGYGWIDYHGSMSLNGFAPYHGRFLYRAFPRFFLQWQDDRDWVGNISVTVSKGQNRIADTENFGFRLDARIPSVEAQTFALQVAGWPRHAEFTIDACQTLDGLITPWNNMTSNTEVDVVTGPRQLPVRRFLTDSREHVPEPSPPLQPPPSQSPIVIVLFVMHPRLGNEGCIFQAQQILRFVEYYLMDAGVQRVMVYMRQPSYRVTMYRDYLARHIPPQALPYTTFVIWGQEMEYVISTWDQHFAYYHANTALSGYPEVMAAYPDLDEYIAWPRPATSLHQALALCNVTLESIGLSSMYANCGSCAAQYHQVLHADRVMWDGCESPEARAARSTPVNGTDEGKSDAANGKHCKWYKEDPLLQYNRTWDDTFLRKENKTWANVVDPGTWDYYGKHLSRVQSVKVFNMHRAELFGAKPQVFVHLDPDTCPFIAHLFNINGYRTGSHAMGELKWFKKNWRSKWWILPPAETASS